MKYEIKIKNEIQLSKRPGDQITYMSVEVQLTMMLNIVLHIMHGQIL
jgi:hypothetical protein